MQKLLQSLLVSAILSLPISSGLYAQVDTGWVRLYDGGLGARDEARDLVIDSLGNIYVTGISIGISESLDIIVLKFDSSGDTVWTRRYAGPSGYWDWANAIALSPCGLIYVTGYTEVTTVDTDAPLENNFITICYDSEGSLIATRQYTENFQNDAAIDIAVGPSNRVYVTGESSGSISRLDIVTQCYSPNLDSVIWSRRFDGDSSNTDRPAALTIDSSGNVFVAGRTNTAPSNLIILKYSPSGDSVLESSFVLEKPSSATDIVMGTDGKVYVVGRSEGLFLTMCLNEHLDTIWTRLSTRNSDDARAVELSPTGNVIAVGQAVEQSSFPVWPPSNHEDINSFKSASGTYWDYATVTYDPDGNAIWSDLFGTGGIRDAANDVCVDRFGNIYVTGVLDHFGVNPLGTIAYNASGDSIWAHVLLNGANGEGRAIAVDINQNVYVAGTYDAGISDLMVVKYNRFDDTLRVTPSAIGFAQTQVAGADVLRYAPLVDTLVIGVGVPPVPWTLTKAGPWFNVDKTSGMTPDTVLITASPVGLSPGVYHGSIAVAASTANGSPEIVDLSIHIEPAVEVGSNTVSKGASDSLPVYISHDTIAGFFIPLDYSSFIPQNTPARLASTHRVIRVDSLRISDFYRSKGVVYTIDSTKDQIIVWRVPIQDEPISSPDTSQVSLVGTIFYTIDSLAENGVIPIDTVSVPCPPWISTLDTLCSILYIGTDGSVFTPEFDAGEILIIGDVPSENQVVGRIVAEPNFDFLMASPANDIGTIGVSQIGDHLLEFEINKSTPYLNLSHSSGITPTDIIVSIGISPGTNVFDTLIFASPKSANDDTVFVRIDVTTGVIEIGDFGTVPAQFTLSPSYPNPFNSSTQFVLEVPEPSDVSIHIYNILGQSVATILQGSRQPGRYVLRWNGVGRHGEALASGIYFIRLRSGDLEVARQITLLK